MPNPPAPALVQHRSAPHPTPCQARCRCPPCPPALPRPQEALKKRKHTGLTITQAKIRKSEMLKASFQSAQSKQKEAVWKQTQAYKDLPQPDPQTLDAERMGRRSPASAPIRHSPSLDSALRCPSSPAPAVRSSRCGGVSWMWKHFPVSVGECRDCGEGLRPPGKWGTWDCGNWVLRPLPFFSEFSSYLPRCPHTRDGGDNDRFILVGLGGLHTRYWRPF